MIDGALVVRGGTGRRRARARGCELAAGSIDESTRGYDLSATKWRRGAGEPKYVARRQYSRSYFDVEERMRVFQEYDARYTQGSSFGTDHGVWEEYRYDPLGRRVMVVTRRESPLCTAPGPVCISAVTRFVWSGDRSCGS